MSALPKPVLPAVPKPVIVYPESDGKPMADNTKQLRWIFVFVGNLSALFMGVANVFVGGNQFWYPREGEGEEPQAPDAYVVFGRPKGDRSSWKQWEEKDVPMTVVFEILSPGNTYEEMSDKLAFYDEHGVEEYYVYNPDGNKLDVYLRRSSALVRHYKVNGFVSPRLGIRFDFSGKEMTVFYPDGRRFLTFEELEAERERERQARLAAELLVDREKGRADQAEQRAGQAEQRATRMAELSRKARRGQASAAELQELESLEDEATPPGTP